MVKGIEEIIDRTAYWLNRVDTEINLNPIEMYEFNKHFSNLRKYGFDIGIEEDKSTYEITLKYLNESVGKRRYKK
ncbi:MAG: hypothetical protein EOL97_13540 [Spirochaetia bacterium]|nr:hypothetical protein [Spirochaetia bacterium]